MFVTKNQHFTLPLKYYSTSFWKFLPSRDAPSVKRPKWLKALYSRVPGFTNDSSDRINFDTCNILDSCPTSLVTFIKSNGYVQETSAFWMKSLANSKYFFGVEVCVLLTGYETWDHASVKSFDLFSQELSWNIIFFYQCIPPLFSSCLFLSIIISLM